MKASQGLDLVITDFEPISARVARRHRVPAIGIGHQYAFVFRIPAGRGNPRPYPDVASEVVGWLDRRRWDDGGSLSRSLWNAA